MIAGQACEDGCRTSMVSAGISCGFSWIEFLDETVESGDVLSERGPLQGCQRHVALLVFHERQQLLPRLVACGDETRKMDLAPARVRTYRAHVQQRQRSPDMLSRLAQRR